MNDLDDFFAGLAPAFDAILGDDSADSTSMTPHVYLLEPSVGRILAQSRMENRLRNGSPVAARRRKTRRSLRVAAQQNRHKHHNKCRFC